MPKLKRIIVEGNLLKENSCIGINELIENKNVQNSNNTIETHARKRRKGEGKRLNENERMNIIAVIESENSPSLRKIAKLFGVGEKTVRDIKVKKEEIKHRYYHLSKEGREQIKRVYKPKYPELEERICDWLKVCGQERLAIPLSVLQHKALLIASSLGIKEHEFKASSGWVQKFRKRLRSQTHKNYEINDPFS